MSEPKYPKHPEVLARRECPKCHGQRRIPLRFGSQSVTCCDRCEGEGWVTESNTVPPPCHVCGGDPEMRMICSVCPPNTAPPPLSGLDAVHPLLECPECERIHRRSNAMVENGVLYCKDCWFQDEARQELKLLRESARQKPPLGPTPDFIWRESRMEELTMACKRAMDAGLFPNQPWLVEMAEHRAWFKATGRNAPCETEWETPLSAGAHYLNEAAEILESNKNERNA